MQITVKSMTHGPQVIENPSINMHAETIMTKATKDGMISTSCS